MKRSREELAEHLRTQVGFLQKSARAFDEGDETEAIRLAVTIRVLVHNSKTSTSLLKQLGVQHQLKFVDTAPFPPEPTTPGALVKRFDGGLAYMQMNGEGAKFCAPLDDNPPEPSYGPQPFRTWWNRQVIEDLLRERFTRAEVVLFLANKSGGAHIDPKLVPRFEALTKFNSLGWGWSRTEGRSSITVPAGPEDTPLGNPLPANVRQIAYELEATLTQQLGDLLDSPTEVPTSLNPSSQP